MLHSRRLSACAAGLQVHVLPDVTYPALPGSGSDYSPPWWLLQDSREVKISPSSKAASGFRPIRSLPTYGKLGELVKVEDTMHSNSYNHA